MNPLEFNQALKARMDEIVRALDPLPATNALIEAMALLTLSAYAAQAGSLWAEGDLESVWMHDAKVAWNMASNLKLPESNWIDELD